jgi:hypothetical protein
LLIFDDKVVALCESELSQFREKDCDTWSVGWVLDAGAQNPDPSYFSGLLRARGQRPCRRCSAEQRNELAPIPLIECHSTPNEP